jgi:hypothetical protein
MQWVLVWRLCRALGGYFLVTAGEAPRHSHRRGVRGIVYAVAPPAIRTVVVPTGVTVLLGLRTLPRSWIGTVGPSLPSFTIAPYVDSFLCYRIDQAA